MDSMKSNFISKFAETKKYLAKLLNKLKYMINHKYGILSLIFINDICTTNETLWSLHKN